jgi:hypothetical protein
VDRPFAEKTAKVRLQQPASFGRSKSNGSRQGTADIVGRRRAAEHVPVRQLNRGRRHSASKADRMSAGRRIQLAHPTQSGSQQTLKAAIAVDLKPEINRSK